MDTKILADEGTYILKGYQVWVIPQTGELFLEYDDYLRRYVIKWLYVLQDISADTFRRDYYAQVRQTRVCVHNKSQN